MNIEKWAVKNREVTLYLTDKENMPLIVFNTYEGDGKSIYDKMVEIGCSEFNFLVVGNLNWDDDMTPWYSLHFQKTIHLVRVEQINTFQY